MYQKRRRLTKVSSLSVQDSDTYCVSETWTERDELENTRNGTLKYTKISTYTIRAEMRHKKQRYFKYFAFIIAQSLVTQKDKTRIVHARQSFELIIRLNDSAALQYSECEQDQLMFTANFQQANKSTDDQSNPPIQRQSKSKLTVMNN